MRLPLSYSISAMTGCSERRVPCISHEEALESGNIVKIIDTGQNYPMYGIVKSINYALKSFELVLDGGAGATFELQQSSYPVFEIGTLDCDIPTKLGTAIICDNEIFTVVNEDIKTVWVGNNNLVYYPEDIQALIKTYGYQTLIA